MGPGDVVADRFEIERLTGSGGMGRVYLARDRRTGAPVALKVLGVEEPELVERFSREAQVLAELDHPAIVGYVAHGLMPSGAPWLAMEWLDGETLADRLSREGLLVAESVAMGKRVAEALGVLHRRGIVHRDLKPGNVFLPGGSLAEAKLLDFGIVRRGDVPGELTKTGVMIGTPGYMAPEQARGERDLDATADVFALGCVLFKCLTGRRAFDGDDAMTVLLKIVLEDPPRVRDLNPEVPEELASLVHRMLAKARSQRPADGGEVAAALGSLAPLTGGRVAPASIPGPSLTTIERRVMCLILARLRRGELVASVFSRPPPAGDIGSVPPASGPGLADLHAIVEPFGGNLDVLAGGVTAVAISGQGTPTDLAARAARCALRMREVMPDAPMALVAGRADVSARSPMSEAIDRGVRLLARSGGANLRLDEVTAGLLDARFEVGGDGGGLTLRAERDVAEATRTLLGRPTPCVGREQELGILEAVHAACVAEPIARAVLVTGAAGVGKSRLRYEFLKRAQQREPSLQVLIGRGDPMSIGSPFGMLAAALRRALGLREGEPAGIRQQRLQGRVGRHLAGPDRERVAEFIAELAGIPSSGEPSVQLRAARKDPTRMGHQMRRAFEDLLHAECSAGPLVLVLEDLHWGDLPTVNFVDSALRHLRELPFLVLALARPEVHETFPKLWSEREVQTVRLGQLTRKSSEKLVREVLGDGAEARTVSLLVERSAGNAFYLEELIRSVAEGKGDALPETIVAMAESRLARLDPEARRVLRAASVFGQLFWTSGVAALLGRHGSTSGAAPNVGAPETAAWLDSLVTQEVISRRGRGGAGGEEEFVFRHALVREAAYAMLTEADRTLGHRLAAEWLEQTALAEPMALAEHFERGGEPGRAIGWFRRAAAQALEGNDFAAVLARVQRAIDCGATGETLGALYLLEAEAHRWRGELAETERSAAMAMERLALGGEAWCSAATELAISTATLGHHDRLAELAAELGRRAPAEGASGPYATVSASVAVRLFYSGRRELADDLFLRLEQAEIDAQDDPAALAEIHQARGYRAHFEGDLSRLLRCAALAQASFERAGELRNAVQQHVNAGYAALELGDHASAEAALRSALAEAERLGLPAVAGLAKHNLGLALARRGALAQARACEQEAIASASSYGHLRMVCGARLYLALILCEEGSLDAAEAEVTAALEASSAAPLLRPKALAALARILLVRGDVAAALARAREAVTALEALETIEEGESLVRLVYAEALHAGGDAGAAAAAIATARDRLLERAAKISEPEGRASFLAGVPDNARTLELAAAWTATRKAAT